MARESLDSHYKFRRLRGLLGAPVPHVRGYLACMWETGYESGNPYLGRDAVDVEGAAQWPGEPGALFAALLDCGWIEPSPVKSGYQIHDLMDHAPEMVWKRARREIERLGFRLLEEKRSVVIEWMRLNPRWVLGVAAFADTRRKPPGDATDTARTPHGHRTDALAGEGDTPAPAPAPTKPPTQHPPVADPPDGEAPEPAAPVAAVPAALSGPAAKPRKPPPSFDPAAYPFPDPRMDRHPTFRGAWQDWCRDRAKRGKRLTEAACKRQLAKLSGWGSAAAVASIEQSIEAGWAGLFLPRDFDSGDGKKARNNGDGPGLIARPQGQGGGDDFDLFGGPT